MLGAWHNIHVAIIAPAMAIKRKAYTVTVLWRWPRDIKGGSYKTV